MFFYFAFLTLVFAKPTPTLPILPGAFMAEGANTFQQVSTIFTSAASTPTTISII